MFVTDINEVSVGDVALAVGNPPGRRPDRHTGHHRRDRTQRGESGRKRHSDRRGDQSRNSGDALIDTAGRLVGINVAILSHSGGSEGIGFAIPVDYVQTVASAPVPTRPAAR